MKRKPASTWPPRRKSAPTTTCAANASCSTRWSASQGPGRQLALKRALLAAYFTAGDNPDRVRYRRGFVTKHQVTGWRFVMRRLSAGVAMHDARMLVDPKAYNGKAGKSVVSALASTWRNQDGSLYFKKPEQYAPAFES